jgi:hypothetical protein
MREQFPVLEILIVPEGEGARLYLADWCSPALRARLDAQKSARLEAMPDLVEFDRFMFGADAPYRKTSTNGKHEISARGRSAIVLDEWIRGALLRGPARGEFSRPSP